MTALSLTPQQLRAQFAAPFSDLEAKDSLAVFYPELYQQLSAFACQQTHSLLVVQAQDHLSHKDLCYGHHSFARLWPWKRKQLFDSPLESQLKPVFSQADACVLEARDCIGNIKLFRELLAAAEVSRYKLLLRGNAGDLALIYESEPTLQRLLFAEVELRPEIDATEINQRHYLNHLSYLFAKSGLAEVRIQDQADWLKLASTLSEHQNMLNLDFSYPCRLWAQLNTRESSNDGGSLSASIEKLSQENSQQRQFSDQSFKEEQIQLWVDSKVIGQINGLSVIDLAGVGQSFGEPIRITATIHQGDGDISDVERKSDLAGSIHAKSMMIIQGYLSSQFAHEHHFPLSGTVVFEQSYHEIDGDSASLAGALAMLSALSKVPIEQRLAVTGAIDQQGNVLAVGGLNEKIEGFYRVCKIKGLNGQQGVVIPHANRLQLNLSDELIAAVEQGQFAVYSVKHINEAIELIMGHKPGSIDQPESLFGKIYSSVIDEDSPRGLSALIGRICNLVK